SALVRRITVKIDIRPTIEVPMAPIRHAEMAPMDVSEMGPVMARNAGLVEMLSARVARSAASGYSEAMVENVEAATAPMPTPQASSGMRSRRRLSLINAPVPVSRSRVARPVTGALLMAIV